MFRKGNEAIKVRKSCVIYAISAVWIANEISPSDSTEKEA